MQTIDIDRDDLAVTARSGDEHNPGSARGLVLVTITSDKVLVENRHVGQVRKWEASPRPALMASLRDRLRESEFPHAPSMPPPPAGSTFRTLRVDAGGSSASVMIRTNDVPKLPTWSGLFALIDAVAVQASRGELALGKFDVGPLVDT